MGKHENTKFNIDPKIEKIFQANARLKIISYILVNTPCSFTELIDVFKLTRGNLSMHIKTLENAEYITVEKTFVRNRPNTKYTITQKGRKAFGDYVTLLDTIINISRKEPK